MASSTTAQQLYERLENELANLPGSSAPEFAKGRTIYCPDETSNSIYLVVKGKVGLSQIADDGSQVLLEIVRPNELFGESAFLDIPPRMEVAAAIERTQLMAWPVSDMEDLVMERPRLAVVLLQILAQRNAEFSRRIESLSIDTVERRLARSLIRFSERFGTPEENGSVRMMPFTHAMLSRYVGTSREVVTQHMNRFRRQGYVSYSRHGMLLYPDPLKTLIDRSSCTSASASS